MIQNTAVYSYQDELIVELTAEDRDGDLVVISYQFEYAGPGNAVTPKEPVDDAYEELVKDTLAEYEYRWV